MTELDLVVLMPVCCHDIHMGLRGLSLSLLHVTNLRGRPESSQPQTMQQQGLCGWGFPGILLKTL